VEKESSDNGSADEEDEEDHVYVPQGTRRGPKAKTNEARDRRAPTRAANPGDGTNRSRGHRTTADTQTLTSDAMTFAQRRAALGLTPTLGGGGTAAGSPFVDDTPADDTPKDNSHGGFGLVLSRQLLKHHAAGKRGREEGDKEDEDEEAGGNRAKRPAGPPREVLRGRATGAAESQGVPSKGGIPHSSSSSSSSASSSSAAAPPGPEDGAARVAQIGHREGQTAAQGHAEPAPPPPL